MKSLNVIHKIKTPLLMLFMLFLGNTVLAQDAAAATPAAASGFSMPVNTVLAIVAIILLIVIIMLAATVNNAIGLYKHNKENSNSITKNAVLVIGFLLFSATAFSQDATAAVAGEDWTPKLYFYGFLSIIVIEVAIIFFFIKALRFLTGIEQYAKSKVVKKEEKTIWETINQFKPLEEEDNMDTGHNYDGIRELDNITPPWFTVSFIATIIFAVIYLYRYHVAESAPLQIEEFEIEMREAKAKQEELLLSQGNQVDENTVVMLGTSDIEAGGKLYTMNCAACHGDKGQGGVGPNLTDAYWIHGGSISSIFKILKYGVVEKGMKSWKDDFSPNQIAQLSSYVESLKGTNPPGAKEKQGELYVEEATAAVPVPAADSAKIN